MILTKDFLQNEVNKYSGLNKFSLLLENRKFDNNKCYVYLYRTVLWINNL